MPRQAKLADHEVPPREEKNLDSRETFVCKCSTKLQNLDLHFHVCVRRDADEIG